MTERVLVDLTLGRGRQHKPGCDPEGCWPYCQAPDCWCHQPRGEAETCPATITVAAMAYLPLDCVLLPGHDLPHIDSVTGTRWVP